MFCIKCKNNDTKCVDDMLQVGYIAEIYKCNQCKGMIKVSYYHQISHERIKEYKYHTA